MFGRIIERIFKLGIQHIELNLDIFYLRFISLNYVLLENIYITEFT